MEGNLALKTIFQMIIIWYLIHSENINKITNKSKDNMNRLQKLLVQIEQVRKNSKNSTQIQMENIYKIQE